METDRPYSAPLLLIPTIQYLSTSLTLEHVIHDGSSWNAPPREGHRAGPAPRAPFSAVQATGRFDHAAYGSPAYVTEVVQSAL